MRPDQDPEEYNNFSDPQTKPLALSSHPSKIAQKSLAQGVRTYIVHAAHVARDSANNYLFACFPQLSCSHGPSFYS